MLRDVCCLLQSHQQLPKWEMRQHCSTPTPAQALGLTPLHDPSSPADALDASMAMPACAKGAGSALAHHAPCYGISLLRQQHERHDENDDGCAYILAALRVYRRLTVDAHLHFFARACLLQSFGLPERQRELRNAACRRLTVHPWCEHSCPKCFISLRRRAGNAYGAAVPHC